MKAAASFKNGAGGASVPASLPSDLRGVDSDEGVRAAGSSGASPHLTWMATAGGRSTASSASWVWVLSILWLVVVGAGCSPGAGSGTGSAETTRRFEARGLVREVATNRLSATIRHEEIPGYMPRMTMGLNIRDPRALDGVSAGDEVTFTLVATADEHWIENVHRTGRREEPKAAQAPVAASKARELKPGDAMPDFEFMKEDGGRMRLSEFRGRSLAFTFFFTRCPIPEYCPKMAKGFAQARELLLKKPSQPTNWQFLCLSFDAEFDRPQVLAGYAKAYRGENPAGWTFGAVDSATLISVAPMLDLIVTQDTNGFSHNLRTVVLDPAGRIHRQFDGNEWTPAELVQALEEAKGGGSK